MQPENRFITIMKQIWPYIYRGLNTVLYGLIKFLRENVKRAFEQLRSGGGY